jgi:hypothetical protein
MILTPTGGPSLSSQKESQAVAHFKSNCLCMCLTVCYTASAFLNTREGLREAGAVSLLS